MEHTNKYIKKNREEIWARHLARDGEYKTLVEVTATCRALQLGRLQTALITR
jgi:hypothetical protein